jgi:hypothetical protein
MKLAKLSVVMIVLVLTANVFAVYTPHIGGSAGGTIYVKGPYSGGPDNSPLHESWNLTDQLIDGNPNPNYLGLYYQFIFYDGTLHIDPTGKVGFTQKIFASGNDSTSYPAPQKGIVNVEGILFGPEIRPWKNGCPMELNVMSGLLEISNILRVGVSDGGVNTGVFNLSGGLAKLNNMDIYGASSYIDITGGELLVLNSNWSVASINAAILANKIINTNGENLNVTTKTVDSILYTSVTVADACTPSIEPDYHVRVHCSGRKLVDGNDNELQLRGIYSRASWILDGGNEQDIIKLKNWGCNFMRITIPFDSDYWATVNGGVFDINKRGILREQDLLGMDSIANWCETNKMYFMFCQQPTYQGFDFDLLKYSPTDPNLYAQQMANIAATFAQRYKNYNYLLGYEPFGEPDGINTTSEYAAYKQICTAYVDAIRAVDPNRIVSIAACDGYADPGRLIDQIHIERDNVIYTFSYYPCRPFVSYQQWYGDIRYPARVPDFYEGKVIWLNNNWLWTYGMDDAAAFSQRWNVPVYCHEFGAWGNGQWDGSSPDNSSQRYMRDMVRLFEDNYINWIIWRWQQNAADVPLWWKDLWAGEPNNRAVIEPHGGTFVNSQTVTMHTFVGDANIYYTTDGSDPDTNSTLYTGGFAISSDTTVKARVIKEGLVGQPTDTTVFEKGGVSSTTLTNPVQGIRYWIYDGQWNAVPDFDSLQASSTGITSDPTNLVLNLPSGKAILLKGYLNVPQDAIYYFNSYVDAIGGTDMYIGDTRVILNGTGTDGSYSVGQIALKQGMHPFRMGYTRPSGASNWIMLAIQRPSDSTFVYLPNSMLYYNNASPGKATNPSPNDGAVDVSINRDLRWTAGADAVSHDFYFGKTNPPPFVRNQSGAMYDPCIMDTNSTYYWRADAKNSSGTTAGDIWRFTTGSDKYLIGWWKFDESFGSVASDSSSSGNEGQLMNMDSGSWTAGRNGAALWFDGYNDYVWIPYNPSLDLGTSDFSFSMWVKKDALTTSDKYLYNQRMDGYNWFYLQWKSTNVIQATLKLAGTEQLSVRSSSPLSASKWYHIVLVVDRDLPSQTKVYIDNVNNTSGTPSVNTVDYSLGAGVSIGRWSGGSGQNWDGIIDDFRFYSWALNENEVSAVYDYGFITGDINKNDRVDNVDLGLLGANWRQSGCAAPLWCSGSDIDKNSAVDTLDLLVFAEHWLQRLE